MSTLEIIFFAILQGIFEFLPISSTGHLLLFAHWLNVEAFPIWLLIAVHIGSLLAILYYARGKLKECFLKKTNSLNLPPKHKLLIMLVISTIPLVIFALLFGGNIQQIETSKDSFGFLLGIFTLINALVLFWLYYLQKKNRRESAFTNMKAFVIGIFQGLAIIPGFSRSGFAIFGGRIQGIETLQSVWFSLLLSIPAIAGAGVYLFLGDLASLTQFNPMQFVIAFVVSFISSVLSVHLLISLVKKIGFLPFALYGIVLAGLIFII